MNLKEMEVSNMLDVLHFFLEEDLRYPSVDAARFHESIRRAIFSDWYGVEQPDIQVAQPDTANSEPIKPFIPPTPIDYDSPEPFGEFIGAPVN